MKKLFSLLMVIVMLLCAGCSSENTDDADIKTYEPYHMDFPRFDSAEGIIDASTHIFEGRVIDIEFAVLNGSTYKVQKTPIDPQEANNYLLCTVYKIAVIRTYKGKTNLIESVFVFGGVKDQMKAEQKQKMEQVGIYDPNKGIQVLITAEKYVERHKTYLFCVRDVGADYKGAVTPQQFALEEGSKRAQRNPAEDPNEVKKYLPYVPHPLLIIGGVAVVATTVVLMVAIRKKRKKTATVSQLEEPTDE